MLRVRRKRLRLLFLLWQSFDLHAVADLPSISVTPPNSTVYSLVHSSLALCIEKYKSSWNIEINCNLFYFCDVYQKNTPFICTPKNLAVFSRRFFSVFFKKSAYFLVCPSQKIQPQITPIFASRTGLNVHEKCTPGFDQMGWKQVHLWSHLHICLWTKVCWACATPFLHGPWQSQVDHVMGCHAWVVGTCFIVLSYILWLSGKHA